LTRQTTVCEGTGLAVVFFFVALACLVVTRMWAVVLGKMERKEERDLEMTVAAV
jgi:hypothetical protein